MSNKNKNRPSGATPERSAEHKSHLSAQSDSDINHTTIGGNRPVSDMLRYGIENAVTAKDLVQFTGYTNTRQLTMQIEHERRAGSPICASVSGEHKGYFLADTPEEMQQYIKALDRRITEMSITRAHCAKTLAQMSQKVAHKKRERAHDNK